MGTCGCCTVMIDGEPRLSCLTMAQDAQGCKVTTVEGLADGAHLAPIQQCFAEHGGSQCGFCTPGFLVASQALLNQNSNPSDSEIACAIEGNLCRCTGYQQIIESIQAAAAIHRGDAELAPAASGVSITASSTCMNRFMDPLACVLSLLVARWPFGFLCPSSFRS